MIARIKREVMDVNLISGNNITRTNTDKVYNFFNSKPVNNLIIVIDSKVEELDYLQTIVLKRNSTNLFYKIENKSTFTENFDDNIKLNDVFDFLDDLSSGYDFVVTIHY